MHRRLAHASVLLQRYTFDPRFGFSLHGQGAQLKTVGHRRLLSLALVLLLHFGFLWVLQGWHTPTPQPQAPLPRLAPTVLVLLPPLPDKKRPLEPARAGNFAPLATAPPPVAEPASAPLLPSARLSLTAEQRMSKTLAANGSGPWVEERVDAEHVRFRSGDLCITYTRQVTAALFPFDGYGQRLPWAASGMQACPN